MFTEFQHVMRVLTVDTARRSITDNTFTIYCNCSFQLKFVQKQETSYKHERLNVQQQQQQTEAEINELERYELRIIKSITNLRYSSAVERLKIHFECTLFISIIYETECKIFSISNICSVSQHDKSAGILCQAN